MLGRVYNGVCASLGAAASAQFPAFYTQYLQRVSGQLDQARMDIAGVVESARNRGLSVSEYLDEVAEHGDEYSQEWEPGARTTYEALQNLEAAYTALRTADVFERPAVFFMHLRADTAQAALYDFTPALPLSMQGLGYAGAGVLIGIVFAWISERPLVLLRNRLRARGMRSRGEEKRGEGV